MGFILKVAGGFFLLSRLFFTAASSFATNLSWRFLPLKKSDFKLDIDLENLDQGELPEIRGILRIRLEMTNKNPVDVSIQGLTAKIAQSGFELGKIRSVSAIDLPVDTPKIISLKLEIVGQKLVDRLKAVFKGQGILNPISIKGHFMLNTGQKVPFSQTINFFSINA